MLEDFLAQMMSSVYRRPRLLLHMVIVFTVLVLLKYVGIYLPLNIVKIQGLELVMMDLAIATGAILIYLFLAVALLSIINRKLSKALENFDLSEPFKAMDRIRSSCFVDDILPHGESGNRKRLSSLIKLAAISIAITLSYYTSITFFLYAINDMFSLAGTPILSILTSSGCITLSTALTLFFVIAIVTLKMYLQQELNTDSNGEKNVFEEWLEDLIKGYLLENCVGKRGSVILASLAPLFPKYRLPLIYIPPQVFPKELAKSRFEHLVSVNDSKQSKQLNESRQTRQYSIKFPANTSSVSQAQTTKKDEGYLKSFSSCLDKNVLDLESFKEGLLKKLCVANLYAKTDKGEKFIGIIIAFTIPFISLQKLPLRLVSDHRAIMSVAPEEYYTYIALLATDPSAAEFISRLVVG